MTQDPIRIGLVGAGYIAGWHAAGLARVPGVALAGVADPATGAAQALAGQHGARAFDSLDAMIAAQAVDAVHILTPPGTHHDLALQALGAGLHVLVEKPFATTAAQARAMVQAADEARRVIAVCHNFLGQPGYARLKAALADGRIGRVDRAEIRWSFPLPPLRSGPFRLWMLRHPQNLMLELGPHLHAFAHDLFGAPQELQLRVLRPVTLPGGIVIPQGWRLEARAGVTELCLSVSLVEGMEERSLSLRGVAASAQYDYGADTLVIDAPNTSDIVVNPLRRQFALARQHAAEGLRNGWREAVSLNRDQPYALGFRAAFAAFAQAIRRGQAIDARFSGDSAAQVIASVEAAAALLPGSPAPTPATTHAPDTAPKTTPKTTPKTAPKTAAGALVIGGTGFVGRALVRALVARGDRVRVLSRGRTNPFAELGTAVELVSAPLTDRAALTRAMAGVRCVHHLARAEEPDWEGYLRNDVAVTETIAEAALDAGVPRVVYTGTIASYDASDPARTITEDTPFGPMERRNLYARSKALCEERLMALHRARGLGLVIARPGIVIGPGGPLQHWGLGRWHGAGAVRVWGSGHNKLPLVLAEDVADGLIRAAETAGIEGQAFNLVGPPLLSARGYFAALARLTGTRLRVAGSAPGVLYAADMAKFALKRWALRRRGLAVPLLADWRSRAHLARFSNRRACEVLGWAPETDADRLAARAMEPQALFGF